MSTRDARSLSAEALEDLRRRAVAAVESGVSRSEVARLFGVSRKTVGAWVAAYQRLGDDALRPKRRGRRPGEQLALSPARQDTTMRTIVDGTPDKHGMPHWLWTRQAVAELVNREFRVLLSPATVWKYLVRWGLITEPRLLEVMRGRITMTVPVAHTPAAWLRNADAVSLAWAPGAGDVNVLFAVSARGVVFFQARRGPFTTDEVSEFLERLMAQLARGLNVVVHSWPPRHGETLPRNHPRKVAVHLGFGVTR
ncbi:helix-turn-helix domain-containing protein [Actinophytocola sp.]|uniref:helix-turn-helix domain-containing protein n=1 Tax=Actinophytocola sp. TaxID=1872138 RepID=UPI002D55EB32|nr:helix-turn-helix domain-containing protein [Actinophytocola sp.]HYQ62577.1 helix-turn-helix domain-containing protein [Actinophytocola sp.]